MKVLITGATGLVGSEITKLCHEKGIAVNYLTTRKNKIENKTLYQGFYWNPTQGEIDENCIKGVDKIINLVGASVSKRWTKSQKEKILNSRIDSAQLLYQLLSTHDHNITQIVSASAIGIYPDSLQKLYTEDNKETAQNFLGEVVVKWETAIDQFNKLGLDVAKIRIGVVLSDKGGALEKLKKPIQYYIGAPLGSGKQWQTWIHLYDLARLFLFTIEKNLDGVYNGVAPNPVTNKKLTKAIAHHLEKPLFLPNIPGFLLRLILGEMATVVLSSQRVSNAKVDSTGFLYYYTHIDLALEDLI